MEPAQDKTKLLACTDSIRKHLIAFANQQASTHQDKIFNCGSLSFDVEQGLICAGICFVHKSIWRKLNSDDAQMATNAYYQLFDEFKYNERKEGVFARKTIQDSSLQSVASFILEVLKRGGFSPLDFLMSLFYYSEVLAKAELDVHSNIWRLLFVTTMLLADKMWEDRSVKTSDFMGAFPIVTKFQMIEMELAVLKLMSYNLCVPVSAFRRWMNTLCAEELQGEIGMLVQNSEYIHSLRHELISAPLAQKLQAHTPSNRKQSRSPSQDFPSARFNARQTLCGKGEKMVVGKAQVPMLQRSPSQRQVRPANSHSPDGARNSIDPEKDSACTANEVSTAPARASRMPVEKTERCLMAQRPQSQPSVGVVQAKLKFAPLASKNRPGPLVTDSSATKSPDLKKGMPVASLASRRTPLHSQLAPRMMDRDDPSVRHHSVGRSDGTPAKPTISLPSNTRATLTSRPQPKPTSNASGSNIGVGALSLTRLGNVGTRPLGRLSSPRSQGQPISLRAGAGNQLSDSLNDSHGGKNRANSSPGDLGKDPSSMSIQEKRTLFESQNKYRCNSEVKTSTTPSVAKTSSAPSNFQAPGAQTSSGYPQGQTQLRLQAAGRLFHATGQPMGCAGGRSMVQPTIGVKHASLTLRGRSSSPVHAEGNPSAPARLSNPLQLRQQASAQV